MKNLIGYCGLDCEKCDARIATVNNDDAMREKVAKKWSKLNNVAITKEMINCMGCRADGPKTPFCDFMCEIKKCASKSRFETCSNCKNMNNCQTLKAITSHSEQALNNLKSKKI